MKSVDHYPSCWQVSEILGLLSTLGHERIADNKKFQEKLVSECRSLKRLMSEADIQWVDEYVKEFGTEDNALAWRWDPKRRSVPRDDVPMAGRM